MADQIRTINGANALIRVRTADGEKTVGYATGITVTEAYMLNRIDVLGEIDSRDIEPIGRTVSGTIGIMRMVVLDGAGGGAAQHSLVPVSSGVDPTMRTQDVFNFMNDGFDLIIEDSAAFSPDSQVRTRYEVLGCRPSSHSFALSRGALMGVDVAFEALTLREVDSTVIPSV